MTPCPSAMWAETCARIDLGAVPRVTTGREDKRGHSKWSGNGSGAWTAFVVSAILVGATWLAKPRRSSRASSYRDMKWCPTGRETAARVPANPKEYRVLRAV